METMSDTLKITVSFRLSQQEAVQCRSWAKCENEINLWNWFELLPKMNANIWGLTLLVLHQRCRSNIGQRRQC